MDFFFLTLKGPMLFFEKKPNYLFFVWPRLSLVGHVVVVFFWTIIKKNDFTFSFFFYQKQVAVASFFFDVRERREKKSMCKGFCVKCPLPEFYWWMVSLHKRITSCPKVNFVVEKFDSKKEFKKKLCSCVSNFLSELLKSVSFLFMTFYVSSWKYFFFIYVFLIQLRHSFPPPHGGGRSCPYKYGKNVRAGGRGVLFWTVSPPRV